MKIKKYNLKRSYYNFTYGSEREVINNRMVRSLNTDDEIFLMKACLSLNLFIVYNPGGPLVSSILPGNTINTFDPIEFISDSILSFVPATTETSNIMDITPMITPSIVSKALILFALRLVKEILKLSK